MLNKLRTRHTRLRRFWRDIFAYTPMAKMVLLLLSLWILFSAGIYAAELHNENATIRNFGMALYWGVAAFSTAGIADTPHSAMGMLLGGVWIIIGSALFFGTIVATITTYFLRPMQRPHKKIIDVIEYHLEQVDELDMQELDLLKKTVDSLIVHMEQIKIREARKADANHEQASHD